MSKRGEARPYNPVKAKDVIKRLYLQGLTGAVISKRANVSITFVYEVIGALRKEQVRISH